MPDNNQRPGGNDEESLGSLIASAIEKKKTSPRSETMQPSDDEMSLEESIARAKYNKENGIKPSQKATDTVADDDEIEKMIANAMSMKANGRQTQPEEHFVSQDDIENDDDISDDYFDDYDDAEEEHKSIGKKIAGFFVRHKLELIVTALVLLTIAVIVVIAFLLFFNHYYNRIERGDSSIILESIDSISDSDTVSDVDDYEDYLRKQLKGYGDIMASEDVYNILLIGEDLRDTADETRGNTDVMMLVSINQKTKQITLTSFMRDIYLYIPGYYSTRLNAAYATGGAQLLENTIEQNFGIEIDNYVIVNFYTFIEIIDTIGGIDAEITDAMVKALRDPMMEQNMYLGNPWEQDLITEPGTYHLNGNQALGYARIRHGVGDDYGRTARQREVITKIIEKVKGLSLSEMVELLDRITEGENVRWDLDRGEALGLLSNAFDYYKNYEIQELQIPASGTFTDQVIRGMQVLCPDFAANTKLLQMTIYGDTLVDPAVTSTYYLPPTTTTTESTYYYTYSTTTTTAAQLTEPTTTTEPPAEPSVTETPSETGEVTTTPEPTQTTTPSETTTPEPTTTTTTTAASSEEPPNTDPVQQEPSGGEEGEAAGAA